MIDGGEWPSLGPAAFSGVLLLGAYHGINPAMGWLFAVALGMQDRSSRGVWRSLPPIAIGHGAAIGLALVVLGMIQVVVPLPAVRMVVALVLCGMGVYRVVRQRHPSWGGMQVGFRDLVFWSFLMASAHGAGLMVLPLVMTGGESGSTLGAEPIRLFVTLLAHTGSYLLVTASVAWLVYAKVGLLMLRRSWVNLDLVWAVALIATGVLSVLV